MIVLVAESEYRKAEAVFQRAPGVQCVPVPGDEARLAEEIRSRGARHVILGPPVFRDALYRALPRGSVIARDGQGHDGIDLAQATAAGLLCTNTPNVLHDSVAEHTIALLLAAARHLPEFDREMHTGVWRPQPGVELRGKVLAILGCGRIGRAVARIASAGLQMQVIGWHRPGPARAAGAGFVRFTDDLGEAIGRADFVSVHLAATAATRHLIDQDRLALFQPHAWLINTARGAVVDEAALYDALAAGRLGGAALDVFHIEPYAPSDPARDLRALSNVVLTPHVGSSTAEANRRMAEAALRNITLAVAGDFAAMNLLNPEVLTERG
jgi:phosphoglycerate dehydrogenase-like enzyme